MKGPATTSLPTKQGGPPAGKTRWALINIGSLTEKTCNNKIKFGTLPKGIA